METSISKRTTALAELKTGRALRCALERGSLPGLCLLLTLLAGCTGGERIDSKSACVKGNFEKVTLCPGASAGCATNPCNLSFQMPAGEGKYQVTSNNLDLGTFPAGQTVDLGSFWEGSHTIEVQGSDAPPAYFRVVGDR